MNINKKESALFLFLIVLFLFLRGASLLTSVESFTDPEELYRGTLAKELLEGLKRPLLDYQADVYSGGSIVVGSLAVIAFKIFGPTLLALKMVPLGFSFAAFLLLFFFMRRYFSSSAGFAAMVLYLLAPPSFIQLSLLSMGFHSESVFFSLLILISFYEFLYHRGGRSLLMTALFGLISGASFAFTYITFLTVLSCLFAWLLLDGQVWRKKEPYAWLLFFLLGAAPFFLFNWEHGFQGMRFIGQVFDWKNRMDPSGGALIRRVGQILLKGIPFSFGFKGGWAAGTVYYIGILSLGMVWLKKNGKDLFQKEKEAGRLLPALLFPVIFTILYSLANYVICYGSFLEMRYFAPLQFFFILLLAVFVQQKPGKILLFFFLLMGGMGQKEFFFQEPFAAAAQYQGHSYIQLGERWQQLTRPFEGGMKTFSGLIEKYPVEVRPYLWMGLTYSGCGERTLMPGELSGLLSEVPEKARPFFWEGLGVFLSCQIPSSGEGLVQWAEGLSAGEKECFFNGLLQMSIFLKGRPSFLEVLRPEEKGWFYLSAGRTLYFADPKHEEWIQADRIMKEADQENLKWVWRGIGQGIAISLTGLQTDFLKAWKASPFSIPEAFLSDVSWGVGWEVRRTFLEDRSRSVNRLKGLFLVDQKAAEEGMKACESWYLDA